MKKWNQSVSLKNVSDVCEALYSPSVKVEWFFVAQKIRIVPDRCHIRWKSGAEAIVMALKHGWCLMD